MAENLETGDFTTSVYAKRFYEYFNDAFDFLMFIPNVSGHQYDPGAGRRYTYTSVKNDVMGIGQRIFSRNSSWGSAGKLQGVLFMLNIVRETNDIAETGLSIVSSGPSMHELTHRWANSIVPSYSHWGFSSANGVLGGFDIADLVDHGDGKYSAGHFVRGLGGRGGNFDLFSPIELYLAGFIPPEEVPDLWVAEDGEYLRDGSGRLVRDDNGYRIFTANRVKTYTIEDIIAEHGPRVPDHSQAQKDFRAAVILLVDENHQPTRETLEVLSRDVSWFSHAGYDKFDIIDEINERYNFYKATGGRATITMDGLSQFQRRAGAKMAMPPSFGTPPPPIVDHWKIGNAREDIDRTSRPIPAEVEQP